MSSDNLERVIVNDKIKNKIINYYYEVNNIGERKVSQKVKDALEKYNEEEHIIMI